MESAGTLMVHLFKRLKVEMNGAVTEAMEQRGIHYPLNYGVSIPTIKAIANGYGVNHPLAILLYKQQVRELQLCAFYVADPRQISVEQADRWADALTNTELAEQAVSALFGRSPEAGTIALRWLSRNEEMVRYAALLLAAKAVRQSVTSEVQAVELLQCVDALLEREPNSAAVSHGAIVALRETAAHSEPLKKRVRDLLDRYAVAPHPRLRQVASETAWQIE